jgi:hypothetical protein
VNPWLTKPFDALSYRFGLIAYNARDFGFGYLYVDPVASKNVTRRGKLDSASDLLQFIHRGPSCNIPGGCNNMSPPLPELDKWKATGLPAEAHIRLWKLRPVTVNDPPDMSFVIRME